MTAMGEVNTKEILAVIGTRQQAITRFLNTHGWGRAVRRPLGGDASFRRYYRLIAPEGVRLVLMDAPPPHENVRPFVRIARHLSSLGFSVPTVVAMDEVAGLLLLEDLGNDTYTRLLTTGADEKILYRRAADVLIALHSYPLVQAIPPDTPALDSNRLLTDAALLLDWYIPAVTGAPVAAAVRTAYEVAWHSLFDLAVPKTLVLRDFHVDNLIDLPGRQGIQACGLLDFQDAVAGPVTYDLMSFLEDARRDIDPALVVALTRHYLVAFPTLDPDAFATSWAVLAAQRHTRVIGVFTRLCVRDGKPAYLRHIPRVWRLLEQACRHPALASVAAWLNRYVPPLLRRIPVCPSLSARGIRL